MLQFFHKRWFLTSLFILIPMGLGLGALWPEQDPQSVIGRLAPWSKLLTPFVLLLMSITLDSGRMWSAIKEPGAVLYATFVNMAVLPLLTLPFLRLQMHPDYVAGLMVASSVPCTMAAASVWTRKAEGNDAVSMLVTILTNGLCFLVTPLWLQFGIGAKVDIDMWQMVIKLIQSALVPILIGQAARWIGPLKRVADKLKTPLGATAQICILLIVFSAALLQGPQLRATPMGGSLLWATLIAAASVTVLHVLALIIAFWGSIGLNCTKVDVVAITFAGSQKTLPIGIYIATELLTDVPFAVYPMLMFHAMQLFVDTLLLERLKRWNLGGVSNQVDGPANTST